ncbi:MAG: FAD-dependent oxidoreductase [Myxococcota bacterium]
MENLYDVAVIGAGFGGLGAALSLAEAGAKVVLLERLRYPGGCASTFTRGGVEYESGATLFSGFGEHQLFRHWIDKHGLDVHIDVPDPMVELRTPGFRLPISPVRERLVDALVALSPPDETALRRFFRYQRSIADSLWELFDRPELLPPFGLSSFGVHLGRVHRYAPLLQIVGRPLATAVRRFGLAECAPLRTFLDAVCQITVQAPAGEAEAPFALAAVDYFHRGTGHVRGGIGQLASALVRAIQTLGGEVRMPDEVKAIEPSEGGYRLHTRKGELAARAVVANLLPASLNQMLGGTNRSLDTLSKDVRKGWGACMLYRTVPVDAVRRKDAHHLELVGDAAAPFIEGNHVFCSISGADETHRAGESLRTVTVSTHIRMPNGSAPGEETVTATQATMRNTIRSLAPELDSFEREMSASPRTFERFTGRPHGFVGGIPKTAGLQNYRDIGLRNVAPRLFLVGDSTFPGQSTLATAVGGVKVAAHLAKIL